MNRESKHLFAAIVICVLIPVLAAIAIMHIGSDYLDALVFAPFVIIFEIVFIEVLFKISRDRKRKELKGNEELFEGQLKDWHKR